MLMTAIGDERIGDFRHLPGTLTGEVAAGMLWNLLCRIPEVRKVLRYDRCWTSRQRFASSSESVRPVALVKEAISMSICAASPPASMPPMAR
jgi:hypothetical protein